MSQTRAIVDKLLSNVSSMLNPEGFVADMILPPVFSTQKTGKIGKIGKDHLRIETTIAGGRGAYRRIDSVVRSTTSFSIESHGLEDVVTPDDRDHVEAPFEAESDVTNALTILLKVKKEKGLADALTNSSIITQNTTLSGSGQYSHADSNPLPDFALARSTIRAAFGFPPNVAVMDWAVWNYLKFHTKIMDNLGYKYAKPGGISEDELAHAMGVDKVLIAKAVYNAGKEGQADSIVPIWGKHIVLAYVPPSAGRYQLSLGYRMQLSGQRRGERTVYKYSINNPPNTTAVLVEDHWEQLLTDVSGAYLIKNAVA